MKKTNPNLPSPVGFWVLAQGYKDAAHAVDARIQGGEYTGMALIPYVFLCFRSIELSLKSVLVHAGLSEKTIARELGHALAALLDRCQSIVSLPLIGISLDAEKMLRDYSDTYSKKWFEYGDDYWCEPDLGLLRATCDNVCEAVRKHIK